LIEAGQGERVKHEGNEGHEGRAKMNGRMERRRDSVRRMQLPEALLRVLRGSSFSALDEA
jgi:hypothetical protein